MQNNIKKTTIFFFPFAGGNIYSCEFLKNSLSKNLLFYPLELPGRGKRILEPLLCTLDLIVEDIYKQINSDLEINYAFYGHSLGALIAYLIIKKLQKINSSTLPKHLFVSGCAGPVAIAQQNLIEPPLHKLSDNQLIKKTYSFGRISKEIMENEEAVMFFSEVLRADFEALETYSYKKTLPFDIPITAMYGESEGIDIKNILTWDQETTLPLNTVQFTGGHFFIFDNKEKIASILNKYIL